jgi:hypothetical protein
VANVRLVEAIHIAGSIASITAIGLLAVGSVTTDLQFATILAYTMSASIFVGTLGFLVFAFRFAYPWLAATVGKGVAISVSAIIVPLTFWLIL